MAIILLVALATALVMATMHVADLVGDQRRTVSKLPARYYDV